MAEIQALAERLRNGDLVAFPTETVYGLGASALSDQAIQKIYQVKGRPSSNPLIVHVSSLAEVQTVADCSSKPELWGQIGKLARFWPGPLSIVVPKSAHISDVASAGLASIAVRIPAHPLALLLIREAGIPLAAPSANPSEHISPTSAQHVLDSFPNADFPILDGGICQGGIESTVLSLLGNTPQILRPGLISQAELEATLGVPVAQHHDTGAILSPGQMPKHYSPQTKTLLLSELLKHQEHLKGKRVALLLIDQDIEQIPFQFEHILRLGSNENLSEVAQNLYRSLRELDAGSYDYIIIDDDIDQEGVGIGVALLDRIQRAAGEAR
jgi:L-threonylcarbamoyladenylate synthase